MKELRRYVWILIVLIMTLSGCFLLSTERAYAKEMTDFDITVVAGGETISGNGCVYYINSDASVSVPKGIIPESAKEIVERTKAALEDEYQGNLIDYYYDEYIGMSTYDGEKFSQFEEIGNKEIVISPLADTEFDRRVFMFEKIMSFKFCVDDKSSLNNQKQDKETERKIVRVVDITIKSPVYQFVLDVKKPLIFRSDSQDLSGVISGGSVSTIKITDATGIAGVMIFRNEKPVDDINLISDTRVVDYEYDVALVGDVQGRNTIRIIAYDLAGNAEEFSFDYEVDSGAPVIAYSGATNGKIYSDKVILSVTGEDNSDSVNVFYKCQFTNSHGELICKENNVYRYGGIAEFSREYSEEGIYDISMFAYDDNANYTEVYNVSFGIDVNAPVATLNNICNGGIYNKPVCLMADITDFFYEGMEVTLNAIIEDELGKRNVELSPYAVKSRANKNIYTFNRNGKYDISLRAKDYTGHTSEAFCSFVIDRLEPDISVDIGGMSDEIKQSGNRTKVISEKPVINIQASDETTEFEALALLLKKGKDGIYRQEDISRVASVGKNTQFEMEVKEQGEYLFRVQAKDAAENIAEYTAYFIVDENPPIIGYVTDFNEKYLKNFRLPEGFERYIKDETSIKYRAYLNAKEIGACDVSKDGKYLLQIIAEDEAGNRSEETTAFIIDNTLPKIIVKGIDSKGNVTKDSLIQMTLFDKDDYFKSVTVNGKNTGIENDGRHISIKASEYGDYCISVVASDYAGNEITQVVNSSCAYSENPYIVKIKKDDIKTLTKNDEEIHESFQSTKMNGSFIAFCGVLLVFSLTIIAFSLFDMRRLRG